MIHHSPFQKFRPFTTFWVGLAILLTASGIAFMQNRKEPAEQTNPTQLTSVSPSPSPTNIPTSTVPATDTPSPTAPLPTPVPLPAIQQHIAGLSLRDKIAGLLILHIPGTNQAELSTYVARYHPAGLILMGDNIPQTIDELAATTNSIQAGTSDFPYFIAIDEEGCTVKRLASDIYPCAQQLGTQPPLASHTAFQQRSALLKRAGINLNFGIVADITADSKSFIYPRVFGFQPQAVGDRVTEAVTGSSPDTMSTLKHFPGHGQSAESSESSIPQISLSKQDWLAKDAIPFQRGIAAGANVVMFGQLAYTAVDSKPASLSGPWHAILVEEMGFDGLTITDDMIMLQQSNDPLYADPITNAVTALNAGNNLLLYVNNHGSTLSQISIDELVGGIASAVENGKLSLEKVNLSIEKVLTARMQLSVIH